jgi:5-methylcytosine-specific restriction endonuclease McrA
LSPKATVCGRCGAAYSEATSSHARCPACARAIDVVRNREPSRVAHRTPHHRRLRVVVLARDGGVCGICGRAGADTLDYIVPLAHGGQQTLENGRAAHRSCNSRVGATVRRAAFLETGPRTPLPGRRAFPAEAPDNGERGPSVG